MSNSKQPDLGNFIVICPYCQTNFIPICPNCNARVYNQFPIVDLYLYIDLTNNIPGITLNKRISKKPEHKILVKTFLLNALKKKPFISRVITTKPYYDVLNELIKCGFLTDRDIKNFGKS